jgi:hypothetical protein
MFESEGTSQSKRICWHQALDDVAITTDDVDFDSEPQLRKSGAGIAKVNE